MAETKILFFNFLAALYHSESLIDQVLKYEISRINIPKIKKQLKFLWVGLYGSISFFTDI